MGCATKTPRRHPRRFLGDPNKIYAQYMYAYARNMPGDGLFILVGLAIVPNLVVNFAPRKRSHATHIIGYTPLASELQSVS